MVDDDEYITMIPFCRSLLSLRLSPRSIAIIPKLKSVIVLNSLSCDMAAVNFLYLENPPTWAEVETATLHVEPPTLQGQRQNNHSKQPAHLKL
ncbi:hypothetical protein TNCV_508981 [Trichonephila clavipes]|nr:hypothetical protein TNCV_508981 [Trichonephila clavipes]